MALTVLRDDRVIEGRDAASVWAQVANLSRIEDWFPVYQVRTLSGEVPEVGNVLFVSYRRSAEPEEAIRLQIVEWDAGRRFVCEAQRVPGIRDARFEVSVVGEAPDDAAHVRLGFTGDVTSIAGRMSAFEISRRFRQALRQL